jgi:ABC-type bacteriocin/lantibiotic exporter with double-glycine peptidase domain
MPKGLDSEIGEKGAKLSGGQKQRIAILRALIKNSQILLFDEATSALDKENEILILELIEKFSQDKALIMVAHKMPEIIKFDSKIQI